MRILFSCDQAPLWMVMSVGQSIRPSVCASVHHFTMFPSSYHQEIFKSYYQWQKWCPCKRSRSKVKVTEVKTSFSRYWSVTPVWIHIRRWNDGQSLMWHRRGALSFFKAISEISRLHSTKKIINFDLNWSFLDSKVSLNSLMVTKWCTKLEVAWKRCPIVFQGY